MILFLNGSSNAGKTTVARTLSEHIPRSTIVEIDQVIASFETLSPKSRLDNGIEQGLRLIKQSHESGFHVIVPFPLSQAHYSYFTSRLQTAAKLLFFTLDPSLPTALSNRGTRELTFSERDRIIRYYEKNLHRPTFGITIDTSRQTTEQTVAIILRCVADDLGAYRVAQT